MTPPLSPTQAYHARLAGRWVASMAHVLDAHPNQEIKAVITANSARVEASPYFDIGPHLSAHERLALAQKTPHGVACTLFGGIAHGVEQTFHLTGFDHRPSVSYLLDDGKGRRMYASLGKGITKDWPHVAAFWGVAAALLDPRLADPLLAKALGHVYVDVYSTFPDNPVALHHAAAKAIDRMGVAPKTTNPAVLSTSLEHAMRSLPHLPDARARSRLKALAESAIPAAWEHAQAGFAQGPLGAA